MLKYGETKESLQKVIILGRLETSSDFKPQQKVYKNQKKIKLKD